VGKASPRELFEGILSQEGRQEHPANFDCLSLYGKSTVDPFVGWLPGSRKECARNPDASDQSSDMFGLPGVPAIRNPDQFSVLVLGGSVAFGLVANRNLEAELQKRFPERHVVVLSGAYGAWGYPQQFNFFVIHATRVDAVIAVDGYNEHWNVRDRSKMLESPSSDLYPLLMQRSSLRALFGTALLRRTASIAAGSWCRNSFACFFVVDRLQRFAYRGLVHAALGNDDIMALELRYSYPESISEGVAEGLKIEKYKYYIRLLHLISRQQKLKYAHFLQPVPLIGKTLTPEEISLSDKIHPPDSGFVDFYNRYTNELAALKQEGVPIFNLRDVFKDETQTLYQDNIHPNNVGDKMMAAKIAETVAKAWKR